MKWPRRQRPQSPQPDAAPLDVVDSDYRALKAKLEQIRRPQPPFAIAAASYERLDAGLKALAELPGANEEVKLGLIDGCAAVVSIAESLLAADEELSAGSNGELTHSLYEGSFRNSRHYYREGEHIPSYFLRPRRSEPTDEIKSGHLSALRWLEGIPAGQRPDFEERIAARFALRRKLDEAAESFSATVSEYELALREFRLSEAAQGMGQPTHVVDLEFELERLNEAAKMSRLVRGAVQEVYAGTPLSELEQAPETVVVASEQEHGQEQAI